MAKNIKSVESSVQYMRVHYTIFSTIFMLDNFVIKKLEKFTIDLKKE